MNKKVVVQIPAYNEHDVIVEAINDIPRSIFGTGDIEIVVINDGSTDPTLEVVAKTDVRHIVNLHRHHGLGKAYKSGLAYGLGIGADIIVNTDADLQYRGEDIEKLLEPILRDEADVVIGDRQLEKIEKYPRHKFITQRAGSLLVAALFRNEIKDVTSGFRAYTREAAEVLIENLRNPYTYTVESFCILSKKKMRICSVPVNIRFPTRASKLITNKADYVKDFFVTVFKCFFSRY